MTIGSSSCTAASTVRQKPLSDPSPRPWMPSSVSTRTNSQFFQRLPTAWVVMPVIFMVRRSHGHPSTFIERTDAGIGEKQGAPPGAGMDRWVVTVTKCRQQLVEMRLEHVVEVAIAVVEVAGFPHLPRLVAGRRV